MPNDSEEITLYQIPSPKERRRIHADIVRKKEHITDDQYHVFIQMGLSDLRTELTGMNGYLTMLSEGDFDKLQPEQKRATDELRKSCQELIAVIGDLAELGKIQKTQMSLSDQTEKASSKKEETPNASQQIEQYLVGHPKLSEREFYDIVKVLGHQSRRVVKEIGNSLAILSLSPKGNNRNTSSNLTKQLAEIERNTTSLIQATKKYYPKNVKITHVPKILMFEDERMLRDMYETKFRMEGFEVAGYDNPSKDPVSTILKEQPDIILSGVTMPTLDGFSAAKIYKADPLTKHIPLIFLTNLGQQGDVETGLRLGAVSYLIKANHMPIEVVKEVRKALGLPIPAEKPIPVPGQAWHGQSVQEMTEKAPQKRSWWQFLR